MLSKEEKLAWLRLSRCEFVGTCKFWDLISAYGSATNALQSLEKFKRGPIKLWDENSLQQEIEGMKKIGARFVFAEDELYPPLLRTIPDAPPVLAFLGNKEKVLSLYKDRIVAIVGARNASVSALKFAEILAQQLGEKGVTIVSGLARGIDAVAHNASLKYGTIAVTACGINIPYPAENEKLYRAISEEGGIFAEMSFNTKPHPQLFPRRNRIIAGISAGTVVVEAAEQSGSLITARMALEYGRDVFAVPGSPLDARSIGSNRLLKEGAILVQSAQDVLDHLESRVCIQQSFEESDIPAAISCESMKNVQKKVLKYLSVTPVTIDELISFAKVSPREVLAALLELELTNKIVRLHGQRVCLSVEEKE